MNWFKVPTIRSILEEDIYRAERARLKALQGFEYAKAMVSYHEKHLSKLRSELEGLHEGRVGFVEANEQRRLPTELSRLPSVGTGSATRHDFGAPQLASDGGEKSGT